MKAMCPSNTTSSLSWIVQLIVLELSCKLVVPLGFEPRSEEPESSMMDRYTKGLTPALQDMVFEISGQNAFFCKVNDLFTTVQRSTT